MILPPAAPFDLVFKAAYEEGEASETEVEWK